jgi:hypothetical protein
MAQEEVAAGKQRVVEMLDGAALGGAVEIDEDVVSKLRFHTFSIICARVTRVPAFRIRYSSKLNSFGVRSIFRPARFTEWSMRFSSRSSTRSTVSGARAPRRNSARSRAESSENANGFNIRSSAPRSSICARSSARVRLARIRMGSCGWRARTSRNTSSPVSCGCCTSRIAASYFRSRANDFACSPSAVRSTP